MDTVVLVDFIRSFRRKMTESSQNLTKMDEKISEYRNGYSI